MVVSDEEKASLRCQVRVAELNESEPTDDVSKAYLLTKNYWLQALIGKTVMDNRILITGKPGLRRQVRYTGF